MKSQHQIRFKKRAPKRKRSLNAKVVEKSLSDVVKAQVVVGERELQFARALSDTEKNVREASLESLQTWLKDNIDSLSSEQLNRLWKGLFYCIWMADKRPIISATIKNIVDLTDIVGWPFLEALFTCLMREWLGIDHHRINKYYELINVAIEKCISRVCANSDEKEFNKELKVFTTLVSEKVWTDIRKGGLGVALHILDDYVDKIILPLLVCAGTNNFNVGATFTSVIEDPMKRISSSQGYLVSVGKRIRERILRQLPDMFSRDDIEISKNEKNKILEGLSKKVFDIAADEQTLDDIREDLYAIRLKLKEAAL